MVSSKSTSLADITDRFLQNLCAQVQSGDRLVVALSGGVDSVVLLHLLAQFAKSIQLEVAAVHVEHGISVHSGQWSAFCQKICDSLGISLTIHHLKIRKQPQQSLEAVAREARYQIYKNIRADYVVLAQHQDDQAETLLLQLLRGAGVKGLGAMPTIRLLDLSKNTRLFRPLLNIFRSEILYYAEQNGLSWVTDESNQDVSYDRNFLRHRIFPMLEERYPAYRKTLSRSVRHLGEAAHLVDELARIDAENATIVGKLSLQKMRSLEHARAKNLLRYLFGQHKARLPNSRKLEEILRQLNSIEADNRFYFVVDNLAIRCYQGSVEFMSAESSPASLEPVIWQGEPRLVIEPLKGVIEFVQQHGRGIDLSKLNQRTITIRARTGGERFQPDCKRPRRSLKKILQETKLAPWMRNTLPLLFCDDQLVWVAGIGVDCSFQITKGNIGLDVNWHPD
ncbi:tRNA lysidine(34) synthetase TilS [Nitrosomonas sp.]|uniref:tRNA lysidine(34) synthetase TilS n=1 Tax=Nitrosomonas sp. TaxID=42353 RepID=UPI0025D09B90|nr:tRNA lysidine(34) synthetase TilS [Nitrosomonas sp.]